MWIIHRYIPKLCKLSLFFVLKLIFSLKVNMWFITIMGIVDIKQLNYKFLSNSSDQVWSIFKKLFLISGSIIKILLMQRINITKNIRIKQWILYIILSVYNLNVICKFKY